MRLNNIYSSTLHIYVFPTPIYIFMYSVLVCYDLLYYVVIMRFAEMSQKMIDTTGSWNLSMLLMSLWLIWYYAL